jgi:uncharacterized protein
MPNPISDRSELLASMQPVLNNGVYVYASIAHGADIRALAPIVTVSEPQGLTVVVREDIAKATALDVLARVAWISLHVQSDLQAIGFTAAFSSALGAAGISCNVVAGAYHDHIFVPAELAEKAMNTLRALSAEAFRNRSQTEPSL